MFDLTLMLKPAFIIYILSVLFLLSVSVLVASKNFARIVYILFTVIGILLAVYALNLTGEKKSILLVSATLINFYPYYAFGKETMSNYRFLRTDLPAETSFSTIRSFIETRKSGKRCINVYRKKALFETRSSEVLISVTDEGVEFSGYPNKFILNIYKLLMLFILGYLYFIIYSYLGETDIAKFITPISVISIAIIALLGLMFNVRGFVDDNIDLTLRVVYSELKELIKAAEIARVIKIAKKFKTSKPEN